MESLLAETRDDNIRTSRQLDAVRLARLESNCAGASKDGFRLGALEKLDTGTLALFEDGSVSEAEFAGFFKSEQVSEVELETIYQQFDWDNDGTLNPEEFEAAIRYITDLIQRPVEEEVRRRQEKASQEASSDPELAAIAGKGDFINQVFSGDRLQQEEDEPRENSNKARAPFFAPLDLS